MRHYKRLIFVSVSDTLTGPMAEAIMKSKYLGNDLSIHSRGLVVLFAEPINPKAEAVLVRNGLSMKDHTSIGLTAEDLTEDSLILTMQRQHKNKIIEEYDESENVYTLTEFLGLEGDVSIQHGGSLPEYGECYEHLDRLLQELIVKIHEEGYQ